MASQATLFQVLFLMPYLSKASEQTKCLTRLSNGHSVLHCCDNKEEQNGTCVECSIGKFSFNGEPCQICNDGYFGRKCSDKCECIYGLQICDNVHGCITRSTTEEISNEGDIFTEKRNILEFLTPKPEGSKEFVEKPEFIYVICSAILTTSIVLCMIWFRYYTSKNRIIGNGLANANDDSYDTIDDTEVRDLHDVRASGGELLSNENARTSSQFVDLPYEDILPVSEVHVYITERIQASNIQGDNMEPQSPNQVIENAHNSCL